MGVIFYFSSGPTDSVVADPLPRFLFFKTLHILEFALLAILIFYALLKNKSTIIIAYLYALSDEIHQTFVLGRSGRLKDTLFDLLGIFIGLLILRQLKKIRSINRLFT
ncbi:MAG: VanZ family protein [Candidatus Shapirobacteria bacterium GW2011_GWE1_38_10]|uniref:VanZ family protein n=1 Tax=Candidatus Shapirobacteria bacterium GW2011_GWE1_38_10 TaxID=1618488 RepID=A0A0G0I1B5_9BACT|nr:MAG: VanZ family protein [Candidatus Shapirobacteria bacterium GW2011_GWF2_37_20]KKQ49088.1 MAG: VanZ family protein [Candidatus Shapirobacteria bacterium GW2011_GWE1_38_10]KKQ64441.1 MAG: VanZ family protein [Candidatus Shapirobacteria bacterium GW2011_GWF1_38_23]